LTSPSSKPIFTAIQTSGSKKIQKNN